MAFIQPVSKHDLYNYRTRKTFSMIDNYVYLYHTDTLIALPVYPESIQDSMTTTYTSNTPLSSSAPIFSFQSSGPRSLQINLPLHRDMMNQINTASSKLNVPELGEDDYVDILVKQLQAAALPKFSAADKMVNPPIVAIRFGTDIFCKGVVSGGVTTTHHGSILRTNKYSQVDVSFTINEVDPYDAEFVMLSGGYRGLSTTLDSRLWRH